MLAGGRSTFSHMSVAWIRVEEVTHMTWKPDEWEPERLLVSVGVNIRSVQKICHWTEASSHAQIEPAGLGSSQ